MLAQLGVVLKEVVGPLAKAAAEDWCKDRLKQGIDDGLAQSAPDALKKAVKQALKNFVKLFDDELENCGLPSALVKHDEFDKPLGQLLATESVRRELCRAFETGVNKIDWQLLPDTWNTLTPPSTFPDAFEWDELARNYVRRVKGLVRQDEDLARQLELDQQQAIQESNEALVGVPVQFDLREYQESLKEKFGSLSLDSLDTTGAAYDNLRLWKIFVAQDVRECAEFAPQMYELPKERLLELQAAGEIDPLLSVDVLEERRRRYAERPVESVRGVVGLEWDDPILRSVILGDPGSGKSTLLRALALSWADKSLAKLKGEPIPLLIELRLYAQDKDKGICNDFLEYLHRGNTACRLNQLELNELLKTGRAVALFDGVDEVFDSKLREAVVTDIHRFSNRYPAVQMVVTSRWLGYKSETLRQAEFAHYMLQDLNDEQIEDFLERWHALTFTKAQKEERERKQGRLQRAIEESKAIRELAGNPLLLTMMAILNRNQELPRDRARLYEEASKVLLYQWDVEGKLYEQADLKHWQIDVRDKQAMLRKVAHHMQANEQGLSGNVISRDDLEEILTAYLKKQDVDRARPVARVMIEQLRARNFILCYLGADSYAFVHLTFLEYFCASEFVYQFEKERMLEKEDLKALYGEYFLNEAWDEVLRLIAGMVEPRFVGAIIEYLLDQFDSATASQTYEFEEWDEISLDYDPTSDISITGIDSLLLAADCLVEVRARNEVVQPASLLLERMKQCVESYSSNSPVNYTKSLIASIVRSWGETPETFAWLNRIARRYSSSYTTRRVAVQELAKGWQTDPKALNILKNLAMESQHIDVRETAMQELAKGWREDLDVLKILKYCAQEDDNWVVRSTAVQELAKGWQRDLNVLNTLKNIAIEDHNVDVRDVSVQELAKGWREDLDVLNILKNRAREGRSGAVRISAIQELGKSRRKDLDVLNILKICAQEDKVVDARSAAVRAIARGWRENSDTLTWIKACAQGDVSWTVRRVAVQELARGWREGLNTSIWIKTCAQEDVSWIVRSAAVQELARGWESDSALFEFWCDRTLNDPFEREYDWQDNPRQIALQVIVQQYPDHPKTTELLQDRAQNDIDEKLRDWATKQLNRLTDATE